LFGLDAPERRNTHPKRPDIAGNEHVLERGRSDPPGEFHAGTIYLRYLAPKSMLPQLKAIRAKCICEDYLSPRLNVRAVHIGDYSRVCQVELVEALVKAHTSRMQHGAHRTISQEGRG
jgi:hypothetical protein